MSKTTTSLARLALAGAAIAVLAGFGAAFAAPPMGKFTPPTGPAAALRPSAGLRNLPASLTPVGPLMTATPAALAGGGLYMSLIKAANVVVSAKGSGVYLLPDGAAILDFTAVAGLAYKVDCTMPQTNPLAWRASLNGQVLGSQSEPDLFGGHLVFTTPKSPASGSMHVEITQPFGGSAYTLITACSVTGMTA